MVMGDVTVGASSSVWYNAIVRGADGGVAVRACPSRAVCLQTPLLPIRSGVAWQLWKGWWLWGAARRAPLAMSVGARRLAVRMHGQGGPRFLARAIGMGPSPLARHDAHAHAAPPVEQATTSR